MENESDSNRSSCLSLTSLGWDETWEQQFSPYKGPYLPGRVVTVHKSRYEVGINGDVLSLPISGAMKTKKIFPVVGDFVVIRDDGDHESRMIVTVLPRKTHLSRGGAGESAGEQVIAANIDTAFIVTDLEHDFSIPRLLRYTLIIRASGANPVIILNKSDTGDDIGSKIDAVQTELPDIPVIALSALMNTGIDTLYPYLTPGKTIIFLGSSGVGKSTLINALTGKPLQKTGDVRGNDGKGRHTTTVRHLIPLQTGSILIDTPGMREIRIWTAEEYINEAFEDITGIANGCRFSDCLHEKEPGCAIRQAINDGRLSESRFLQYQKMQKEAAFERGKAEIGLKRYKKIRFMGIGKLAKEYREKKRMNTD